MHASPFGKRLKVLGLCNQVRKERKKNVLAQCSDILRLRLGKGKLGAYEYYKYRLYDDELHHPASKRTFAGFRKEHALDARLNHRSWHGMTTDKLIQYSIFKGLGIPIPKIYAVYHPSRRYFGQAPSIRDPEALREFLRRDIAYPFFSKPAHGSFGDRAAAVRSYHQATDRLELLSGDEMALSDYVAECHPREGAYPWQSGYLFQEYLSPHPEILPVCGPRLSSVRMIILLSDAGPRVFRAIWKIATGKNVVDNFQHGAKGNLLATLDAETGAVGRVIRGLGPEQEVVRANPDTGKPFQGFRIPQWPLLVDICLTAATSFPGLRLQHWDIAISARGPVVLEVNIGGDLDLPQLASGTGFLDAEFEAFLSDLQRTYPTSY